MIAIVQDRVPDEGTRCRQINPRATTAKTFLVRQNQGRFDPVNSEKGDIQGFVSVVGETFPQDIFGENVKCGQALHHAPIGDGAGPLECGGNADFHFALSLERKESAGGKGGFFDLAVKPGGKQNKFMVFVGETLPALGDAALPQQNALGAGFECGAHHGPFLQCCLHGF